MRLVELAVNADDLAPISQEQLQPRTAGLHVSAIIRHIMVTAGLTETNDFTDDDLGMFAIIGRLWEQMLADAVFKPPRYQRPGEIELDGIYGSPDAVDCDNSRVMEFKVRWASSAKPLPLSYMMQVKSYCHMLGLAECDLYVFYVAGNWRPPVPQIKAWRISLSPHELKDNWRVIVENGKELR